MPATVLIVDDEPFMVDIIWDILESRGYRVLATTDADRALAMLAEDPGPIDLLLTDVTMPQRTGPELAALVQERWPDCRVIFLSGHTSESLHDRGVPPGARILAKPVTLDALVSAVSSALTSEG